ncbi:MULTISPECIES: sensory rhodopsin transducer [Dietzia]|uniref:sensory rhodopsin transducer n=1 Tax=Dietzia TaxID=37914 RepID=UPI0013D636C1|nr:MULTISPECIES: sensory rhodopsin transducer [Dietzia]MCT1434099.1 sensory rhodopsin transducer [Dietzia maris]MCT1520653.1 sensory rhodopsin transducer [Dietzia maris]
MTTETDAHGSTRWFFSAGFIPEHGTGHEPEYTSRTELCLLNTGADEACVRLTVYHSDRDPVGPYEIRVEGRRVRELRVNDLIAPEAVPLGRPLGLVLESDVPVVAQLRYIDTRRGGLAVTAVPGLPG